MQKNILWQNLPVTVIPGKNALVFDRIYTERCSSFDVGVNQITRRSSCWIGVREINWLRVGNMAAGGKR